MIDTAMPAKEREIWSRIIELYRDSPYLWDITDKNYLNRDMKVRNYQIMLNIYKKWDAEATVELLKKKIKNMRSCYARELKKVKFSAAEEPYVPTLWYYDMFSFLQKITERSIDEPHSTNEVYCEINDGTEHSTNSDDQSEIDSPKKKIRPNHPIKIKEALDLDPVQQPRSKREEECEILGKAIGIQLKDLDNDNLTIVNKLISDVIFYAKSGQLTLKSSVNLGSPNQPYS